MKYSDFGLDEKKMATEGEGIFRDTWYCLWGTDQHQLPGHYVKSGFNLCFSNFAVCKECIESATNIENQYRWTVGDCFKCKAPAKIAYGSNRDYPDGGLLICKECIDWAKDTFRNKNNTTIIDKKMETQEILLKCVVVGNVIQLPDVKLDQKSEYFPIKAMMDKAGGTWNTRAKGFKFEEDPSEILARLQKGEIINIKQEFQFFATPAALAMNIAVTADMLLTASEIQNPKILEPSAGDGALVKAIVKQLENKCRVDCFELMELNRIKLQKVTGADILGNDFLEAVEQDTMNMIREQYDLVIANPPFTGNADIDHIRAMYKCLKPGGHIVTLSSDSWTVGQQKKQIDFREWLSSLGSKVEEIGKGSFKESGTMVATNLITIRKPLIDEGDVVFTANVFPEKKKPEPAPEPEYDSPEVILDQIAEGLRQANVHINEMRIMLNPEEMNFFKQVSELVGESEISFSLKVKNGTMTVMITRGQTASSKPIPPLIINGSPEDLDEGFFGEISTALSKVAGISSNAKAVEQAIDGTEGSSPSAEAPKTESAKKSRSKAVKPADTPDPAQEKELQEAIIDSEGEADNGSEAVDTEEQERIRLEEEQKSQEEHRLKLEQEEKDRLALERKNKFNEISVKADHLAIGGTAADLRAAAFALKEAKEFADDPDALTGTIKAYLTTAAQLEMEEL